jgi:hypothetical protein
MNLQLKSFLLMILVSCSVQGKLTPPQNRDIVIPQFITAVIRECSEIEKIRSDVAIVQLELTKKSEVADEIAEMVMQEVPTSTMLIHRTLEPIEREAASFIILVSDLDDSVSWESWSKIVTPHISLGLSY